jgi:hypothetical protein
VLVSFIAQFHLCKPRQLKTIEAITGIGSDNVVGIPVDHAARISIEELEKKLEESLVNEQAVYAVVAIIGSTEGMRQVSPLSALSMSDGTLLQRAPSTP